MVATIRIVPKIVLIIGLYVIGWVTLYANEQPVKQSLRPIQSMSTWERIQQDLLWNFDNMYQPAVVEIPELPYRYRMFFFGWATSTCNSGHNGCDAIFTARSKDLRNWEVYAGNMTWDRSMNPKVWKPIITADDRYYDSYHNGDPSVVYKDGRYYMAFSASGKSDQSPGKMQLAILGAVSDDGIHWRKIDQPLLIELPEQQNPSNTQEWSGNYNRPSLMWDQGKWRLWFDYWDPDGGLSMGYAENTESFDTPGGFKIFNGVRILNWPNPTVVKVGDRYHSFADPTGYHGERKFPHSPWTARAICEAVSNDGIHWIIVGFIPPDDDAAASHVPQALVTVIEGKPWLYLFYATQRGGIPYDFRYNRIRAIRRAIR